MAGLVHALLQESAKKFPDKTAVVIKDEHITYDELNCRSNQLARLMLSAGIEPGDRIGIYLEKSIEKVIAVFAAAKIGAVFVIINPALKQEQAEHIVENCKIRAIVSAKLKLASILDRLKTLACLEFFFLKDAAGMDTAPVQSIDLEKGREQERTDIGREADPEDLCAIIYTSGSTGRPKGVMLSHANLVLSTDCSVRHLGTHSGDTLLCLLPFSFDYGLNQLLSSVMVGATLVLRKYLFPSEIVQFLNNEKISVLCAIPTIWIALLEEAVKQKMQFRSLRYVTNSGGCLPVKYVKMLSRTFPEARVFLMYGFTEAFRSTYLDPEEVGKRPDSIGKAVPHAEVLVVDKDGKECRPGEIGELIHGGALVTQGYWQDAEATDKKFKLHPFDPSKGMVCWSGDLIKKDEEGFHYFVGREDALIKSSGYRISPEHLEELLYACPLVRQALVYGISDDLLGQRIKAVVSLRKKQAASEADILNYCKESLPNYMIPHSIEIRDELPVTAHGKVDRAAFKI